MDTSRYPMETVTELLKMMNMEVTHQHEDLVFVSGNRFILRFTEDEALVDIFFNETIEEERANEIMAQMEAFGGLLAVEISFRGAYSMSESGDDSLSVEFFDLTDP